MKYKACKFVKLGEGDLTDLKSVMKDVLCIGLYCIPVSQCFVSAWLHGMNV